MEGFLKFKDDIISKRLIEKALVKFVPQKMCFGSPFFFQDTVSFGCLMVVLFLYIIVKLFPDIVNVTLK